MSQRSVIVTSAGGRVPPKGRNENMFLGLRTVIYPAADLGASTAWFTKLLGQEPYFNEPFYVGFNVGGYELGIFPREEPDNTEALTYWGVPNAEVALAELIAAGATLHSGIADVGDGILVAAVREPGGSLLGIIENPQFELVAVTPATEGPGR
jgi:predicted enzyme related to lactoylglutathione lyase